MDDARVCLCVGWLIEIPLPLRGSLDSESSFHGFRFAPPVAACLRPFGTEGGKKKTEKKAWNC